MIKREAKAIILFRHWLHANPFQRTTWYEVKQTTSERLLFSAVKLHQRAWLLACKHNHTNYKIPDDSRGVKPTDGIFTTKSDALVVIKYPDCFCLIDIDAFLENEDFSCNKSLHVDIAKQIAVKVIEL